AILVHDRKALDTVVIRARLGNIDNPAVKITLLAGNALVNLIRHYVSNAAPVRWRGHESLAGQLLLRRHVPQPEFNARAPIAGLADAARDERLRINGGPLAAIRVRLRLLT